MLGVDVRSEVPGDGAVDVYSEEPGAGLVDVRSEVTVAEAVDVDVAPMCPPEKRAVIITVKNSAIEPIIVSG